MALTNHDILLASLVGSKVAGQIPRLSAVQNELMKRALPTVPFLPFTGYQERWRSDRADTKKQFFPLSLKKQEDTNWYTLPYEPLINISGKNHIVKRNVAKADSLQGSIKERFSRGDYEITITGGLHGDFLIGDVNTCFPREDFERLRDYLTAPESIQVLCEPLQLLGINAIIVEDFSFPFSKGESVQVYEIKAISDFSYDLLIDLNPD